jgi:hypothetical protein
LIGNYDTNSEDLFASAGFALIKVNGGLLSYVEIYTSINSSSSSSISSQGSSLSSSSSDICPNDISELTTTVRNDITFTYDRQLALKLNASANKDNYIMLYSGDTSGQSYDNANRFYGDDTNTDEISSNGYISLVINGAIRYIPVYTGTNTTDCCSNLVGEKVSGEGETFDFVGYALIKVNGGLLRYAPIYNSLNSSSSSSTTIRYVDNGDGTVTDNVANLMWLKDTSVSGQMNWQDAMDYCANLDT